MTRREMLATLAGADPGRRFRFIMSLPPDKRRVMLEDWATWAHPGQVPPEGEDWSIWLIRAGRGFGKTRAGSEWINRFARENGDARIALVGGTVDEVRAVMVEGASGIIRTAQIDEVVDWRPTMGELRFQSGATAFVYSGEQPERLRGPEHHVAWCDELAKWKYGDATWDNLMLGLRLGDRPRVVVTTTPKPNALMRRVMTLEGCVETRGRTADNRFLPAAFVKQVEGMYAGSRLGRQELEGELIDEAEGALWTRDLIERQRVKAGDPLPPLTRVVVGVDPPASAGGDACGIVAVGLGADGRAYVLKDASVSGLSPEGWAGAVADCAHAVGADRVVAEKNQGGDMVGSVLRAAERNLPLTLVHAARGKVARAEPVSALYESDRMRHAGAFPELEDELAGLATAGDYSGPGRSPDRADAMVWAATHLMLGKRAHAGVRMLG